MLGNKKGKMICGYVPDYVLFDLETTGTSCIYDEVIEISAVKVRSGKVVEEFSHKIAKVRMTKEEERVIVCCEYG